MLTQTKLPYRPSNLQRAASCPPSVWREKEMPEFAPRDFTDEGTDLHSRIEAAFRLGDYAGLREQQRWAVQSCVRLLEKHTGGVAPEAIFFEHELEVLDSFGAPLFDRSAHLDTLIFNSPVMATIADWKMGYLELPYSAAHDLQGLAYAVAVRNNYEGINRVDMIRHHPRLWDENRTTSVSYAGDDAYWAALEDVIRRIVAVSQPDAPAKPGHAQCLYCKAKPTCAEFKAWAEPSDLIVSSAENTLALTPARIGGILEYRERLKLLNSMMDDIEGVAKQALERGIEIPGWTLGKPRETRSIEDVAAARTALADTMPPDAIESAVSLSVPGLEKAFKAHTGLKGKKADEAFAGALNGLIKVNRSAAPLARWKAGDGV